MFFAYQKVNAKVNLTLDVVGAKEGFHEIESLVSAIDLSDSVLVLKRSDHIVDLRESGIIATRNFAENNAYRAATAFKQMYGTSGVTIYLKKNIPIGGGLGGSSADIAAVLLAMKRLYNIDANLSALASQLGSDVNYMLQGGTAVMRGKGDEITRLHITQSLPLILIKNEKSISSKSCYSIYDQLGRTSKPCTREAVENLAEGKFYNFTKVLKNDLNEAANKIVPELDNARDYLLKSGAYTALMTGSGSIVYGIYYSKKDQKRAYEYLKTIYEPSRIVVTHTLKDKR